MTRLRSTLARFPRNADFSELHLTFLIAGITTVLVIRTQLWLTNYPQLGGAGLHIAHLLYGGAFMVVAIGIAVTFLGPRPRRAAAIVGGVGFGFFIDELGKFITADNNYFFKPASALIYLVFVGLFLVARTLRRDATLTAPERLANAMVLLGGAACRELDVREKQRVLELLEGADPDEPLVVSLRDTVRTLEARPPAPPSRSARWVARVRSVYGRLVGERWFRPALTAVFALWALGTLALVIELSLGLVADLGVARRGFVDDGLGQLHVLNWLSLGSSTLAGVLVLVGLERLRRGRRTEAYLFFERALLVTIFLTRVFSFVESQFSAVFGLGLDLLLLVMLRSLAAQEGDPARPAKEEGRAPPALAGPPASAPGTLASSGRPTSTT